MFDFIRQGMKVYRKDLAAHIKESNRIAEAAKKEFRDHYGGFNSWHKCDREGYGTRTVVLNSMARALGLSETEKKRIQKSVEKKLGMQSPSLS